MLSTLSKWQQLFQLLDIFQLSKELFKDGVIIKFFLWTKCFFGLISPQQLFVFLEHWLSSNGLEVQRSWFLPKLAKAVTDVLPPSSSFPQQILNAVITRLSPLTRLPLSNPQHGILLFGCTFGFSSFFARILKTENLSMLSALTPRSICGRCKNIWWDQL